MKLLRYGVVGAEKPGCLDAEGRIRDLSQHVTDVADNALSADNLSFLRTLKIENLPLVSENVRIGPCVNHVTNFICIGLNYTDHAAEMGVNAPSEPIIFSKASSSICGPHDNLIIPLDSMHTDWEVELGIVMGTKAKRVSEAEALQYVAGYCLVNDMSERHYQLHGTGQWFKGKSCDSFGPIGPWLVTSDEIVDPQTIPLWLEVDGKRFQDGHTRNMIFGVKYLVSYVSRFLTLYPGDIISTGTPAGVGLGQKPEPVYLKPGQVVRLGGLGLGEQNHLAVAEKTF